MQPLELVPVDRLGGRLGVDLRHLAHLRGDRRRDAREVVGEHLLDGLARRVAQHRVEHPELDAVGVRLDLLRLARKLVRDARELDALALRADVRERQVRVGDDGLLEVLLHARAPAAVGRDQLDLDARAVLLVPVDGVLA